MIFSNKDINDILVKPYKEHHSIKIELLEENEYYDEYLGDEQIYHIIYNESETLYLTFKGDIVQLGVLNEVFLFISDAGKKCTNIDETYKNVVYEGALADKTSREVLSLIQTFINILENAQYILVKENRLSPSEYSQEEYSYPKCRYDVWLDVPDEAPNVINIENITFHVNDKQ